MLVPRPAGLAIMPGFPCASALSGEQLYDLRQGLRLKVRWMQVLRPRFIILVEPQCLHACIVSACDICHGVISDVQQRLSGNPEVLQAAFEHVRLGFWRKRQVCSEDDIKMLSDTDQIQIGIAIGYCRQSIVLPQN